MLGPQLILALITTFLAGALLATLLDRRPRACAAVSFAAAGVGSSLCAALALLVLLGSGPVALSFPAPLPQLGTFSLQVDRLSAFFLLTAGVVGACVSAYSVSYLSEYRGRYSPGRMGALYNVFLLSLVLVLTAGNAVLFLIVWEAMSVSSYLLVVYESRRQDSASAGLLYVVMTHLGTALISVAFVLMWTQTGSFDFSAFATIKDLATVPELMRTVPFLLLLVGFGTKAGLVPLHVWLPQAHPAAPSNVSALMSAVMVKTAVYMLVRCCFDFLGVREVWWGLLVLLIACASALLGVLYAVVERDLKRVLAYSTVENMGIIFIGIGAAMVFQAYSGDPSAAPYLADLAALALVAALFHVLSHALFKSLLFMGAGAVLFAAHTRNVEEMGGLAKRMRYTGALFFVGALAISAIPPLNGFVGEWLMFQSLLLSQTINDPMVNILIPAAVAVLALTGALAAACFVRLFGAAFLARPRTAHAAEAEEVPRPMLAGMAGAAGLCVLTGVLSVLIIPVVDGVSASVLGVSIADKLVNGLVLSPPAGSFSSMSPLAIAALAAVLVPALYLLLGRRPAARVDTWDCGTPLTARNEYTATGHSQPIARLFRSLFRARDEVSEVPSASPLVPARTAFRSEVQPVFERYLYDPVSRAAVLVAGRASVIQKGSIQAYLAYIFVLLLALLVVFR